MRCCRRAVGRAHLVALLACGLAIAPMGIAAQEADPLPAKPDTSNRFANTFNGEFAPGAGFTLISTKRGSLNISVYGLFRYMNQYAVGDSFTDHLGRKKAANPRNDLNWHRTFVWVTGFFYDEKIPVQHFALVTPHDTTDAPLWESPVPSCACAHHRRRAGAKPHGAFGPGFVALLGRNGPADGRRILPRRVLIGRLHHG